MPFSSSTSSARPAAQIVWVDGDIITMDSCSRRAQAMAALDGKLIAVGSEADIKPLIGPDTQVVSLGKKTVVPGLIDSHLHLLEYGQSLHLLPLRDLTKEEILAQVSAVAADLAPGSWITGGMGWNNEVWADPTYPTREELDAAAPHNPVLLPRMDGHLIWVNSRAFEACGIDDDIADPPGGEFMRTPNGRLQGCASNAAAALLRTRLPLANKSERYAALLAAQAALFSYGVTSACDMGTTAELAEDLFALYENGSYKLRVYGALYPALGAGPDTPEQKLLARCPLNGLYGDRYTIRCCKLLGDGSVGAQSARLFDDYSDRPGHRGTLMYTDEELTALVREAAERGMQISIHSIGDETIDQVLRIYEKVLRELPNPDHRWRIEHFQTVTSNTPQRAQLLGVLPSMQPLHAPNSASMAQRRLGEQRIHGAYALGRVLRDTGRVALGSDAPVSTPRPLSGMHAAVCRTNDDLQPVGGFCMENAVPVLDALKGYTTWGAYAQFADENRGSLEAGKHADFVVLSGDPLVIGTQNADKLVDIQVLKTVIAGETVFEKGC